MAPIAIDTVFVVRHGERLGKLLIIAYSTSHHHLYSPLSTTTTTDHVSKTWQPDPAHGLWDPPLSDKASCIATRTLVSLYILDKGAMYTDIQCNVRDETKLTVPANTLCA